MNSVSQNTTQYMTWLTDQGELDWNLLAQDAVKVSGQIISSIDLNTMVEDMLRQIANYIRYFAVSLPR
jgi:inorganic pyrophosphatase